MHEAHAKSSMGVGFWVGLLGFLLLWGAVQSGFWQPRSGHEGLLIGRMLAITWLMAAWWMSEALPIPITSLLPLVLLPMAGIMSGDKVAHEYTNEVIFLFMGGFFLALSLQKWGVHRRMALHLVLRTGGGHPRWLILGFMVACAFLSMWMSNTATVVMLMPIAVSVIHLMKEEQGDAAIQMGQVLLLGLAYAASIGGMATLVGTPPNLSFARIYKMYFPNAPEVSFVEWLKFGLPVTFVLLPTFWLFMVFVLFRRPLQEVRAGGNVRAWLEEQLAAMGPMRVQEKAVLLVFAITAFLWVFRVDIQMGPSFRIPGWMGALGLYHNVKTVRYEPLKTATQSKQHPTTPNKPSVALSKPSVALSKPSVALSKPSVALSKPSVALSKPSAALSKPVRALPKSGSELYVRREIVRRKPLFGDGVVAMMMALLLFLMPAGGGERLLDWENAKEIPWGMLLLFGGGFALAAGIQSSGMSAWIGEIFRWPGLSAFGTLGIILFLCFLITFVTEFTSNTATTEISLAMIAPVVATFGGTGVHPYLLMVPITISASCAFMMPVATPPNAIVYATGIVGMRAMVRAGFWLNLISAVLIALLLYGIFLWMGIPLRVKPDWL
ncbi:SLC13 family permease [Myxococcota bacterium]|nr:SLC13 family permease [Myxococcota bacterium]